MCCLLQYRVVSFCGPQGWRTFALLSTILYSDGCFSTHTLWAGFKTVTCWPQSGRRYRAVVVYEALLDVVSREMDMKAIVPGKPANVFRIRRGIVTL